jgi:hypothetical protein
MGDFFLGGLVHFGQEHIQEGREQFRLIHHATLYPIPGKKQEKSLKNNMEYFSLDIRSPEGRLWKRFLPAGMAYLPPWREHFALL